MFQKVKGTLRKLRTNSTKLPKKILGLLRFARANKILGTRDYCDKYDGKWTKVIPSQLINRPSPKFWGECSVDFDVLCESSFPEFGVVEMQNALLYGEHGKIISQEGFWLNDMSWFGKHENEFKKMPKFISRGIYLKGRVLSIASDFAVNGYGHFVTDCLSRLDLFYKAGYTLADVDYIFSPRPTKGNATVLFDMLKLPQHKLIWADDCRAIRAETLIATSFPGTRRNYPHWVTQFLQSQFIPVPAEQNRRLYVTRDGYKRNIINMDDINNILQKYSFEIYNPIDSINSHLDFSAATMVVGISGSALTGLAFCQTGTKVLELLSTDHVFPYYYSLSDAADLDYHCLVCKSEYQREQGSWGPSLSDIYVDPSVFEEAIKELIGTEAKVHLPKHAL